MKYDLDEHWEESVRESFKKHKGIEDLSKEAKEILRDTIPKIVSERLGEVILNKEYLNKLFGNKAKDIDIFDVGDELEKVTFKVLDTKNGVSSISWVFTKTKISNNDEYTLFYNKDIVKNKLMLSMIFKNIDHELSEDDFDKLYKQRKK